MLMLACLTLYFTKGENVFKFCRAFLDESSLHHLYEYQACFCNV